MLKATRKITEKRISKNGSICIPKNIRLQYGLLDLSAIDIFETSDGGIYIKPHTPICIKCYGIEDVKKVGRINLCKKCLEEALK